MMVIQNITGYLKRNAERVPDRTALAMPNGTSVTFSELWDLVDRFSVGLGERGIVPGDRIIVMVPMSIDLYVVLLGIIKMGAVAIFVDPWIGKRQIARFCSFATPKGFIGIPKSHILRLLEPDLRSLDFTVTTGQCLFGIPAKHSIKHLLRATGDGEVFSSSSEDPALITFTTGSSGMPKGANRTHGFLSAQYHALKHEFPYDDSDSDMPMFPVFALSNLGSGIPSIIPNIDFAKVAESEGRVLYDQLVRHACTTATASPPFFDNLAAYLQNSGKELSLRRILTGGAPVSDDQLKKWKKAFPNTEIQVVYGSTEAEPVAHIDASDRLRLTGKGYCTGIPSALVTTKVIAIKTCPIGPDEEWKKLERQPGSIGELIVSGDHICRDYFNNPDAVKENKIIETDGKLWHRMGDTGYFDSEGRFWLVGRVHSTIFRGDDVYHPQLMEQSALGNDGDIKRVAALGVSTPADTKVVILVEPHDLTAKSPEILLGVRKRLAADGLDVDDVRFVDKPIPMDPRHNSKVDYAALLEWYRTSSGLETSEG